MTLYLDSSALLKRYFDEPDSASVERFLLSDTEWVTGRHTAIEVRRNIARTLEGEHAAVALEQFGGDWDAMAVVELDETTCDLAASIAETTGVRTLDALHLGAAQRAGAGILPFVTFDLRQARAARSFGWTVLGG